MHLVTELLGVSSRAAGRPLTCIDPHGTFVSHSFRPELGLVAGSFKGRLEVAVGSPEDVRHLRETLRGRGLRVGPDLLSLEAQLNYVGGGRGNGRRC